MLLRPADAIASHFCVSYSTALRLLATRPLEESNPNRSRTLTLALTLTLTLTKAARGVPPVRVTILRRLSAEHLARDERGAAGRDPTPAPTPPPSPTLSLTLSLTPTPTPTPTLTPSLTLTLTKARLAAIALERAEARTLSALYPPERVAAYLKLGERRTAEQRSLDFLLAQVRARARARPTV